MEADKVLNYLKIRSQIQTSRCTTIQSCCLKMRSEVSFDGRLMESSLSLEITGPNTQQLVIQPQVHTLLKRAARINTKKQKSKCPESKNVLLYKVKDFQICIFLKLKRSTVIF